MINMNIWNQNQVVTEYSNGNFTIQFKKYDLELYIFAEDLRTYLVDVEKMDIPQLNKKINRGASVYGNIHSPVRYEFKKKRDNMFDLRFCYDFPDVKNCWSVWEDAINLEDLKLLGKELVEYLNKNEIWKDCLYETMNYYDRKYICNKCDVGVKILSYYKNVFYANIYDYAKPLIDFNNIENRDDNRKITLKVNPNNMEDFIFEISSK